MNDEPANSGEERLILSSGLQFTWIEFKEWLLSQRVSSGLSKPGDKLSDDMVKNIWDDFKLIQIGS